MNDKRIESYCRNLERLISERTYYEDYWQDVAKYVLPSRAFLMQWSPGSRRNTRIFDTTGIYANEQFAGGLHGMLTSPASRWFNLKLADPGYRLTEQDKLWLQHATDVVYNVFSSTESGFETQIHETYLELSAFGNGIIYADDKNGQIRFRSMPLSDCYLIENDSGMVDAIYRRIKWPAYRIMEMFNGKVSERIRKIFDQNPMEEVKICHVVERSNDFTGEYSDFDKPYKSCYFDFDGKTILREGGFNEFPYAVPRFSKRSGENYGFGPGMAALPDVKMLNRIAEVTIRGSEKLVDPPIMTWDDSVIGSWMFNPAGITKLRPDAPEPKPLMTNARPDFAFNLIEIYKTQVMKHFYVDWMNLPQGPQMTATEVLQRRDESMRLLGPIWARTNAELNGPLINRVFGLCVRMGKIMPPPDTLKGRNMKVEYSSPIAQAQRFSEMDSMNRTIQFGAFLAQYDPMVMGNFNLDEMVRYHGDINSMPQKLLVSADAQNNNRANAAQQQARAQEAQVAETEAKANKQQANAIKFMGQAGEVAQGAA
jgi:hypothetical protein